ncbi:MAG: ACP S-malonyltransferase [Gammaproteobacteria bacterium]|nr:ACP S-malonyltransferase [Gammaproteobacteria bacterium]MCP5137177.1 ACP S-malonyltransferase [Gammaproteobacteria bacterium]
MNTQLAFLFPGQGSQSVGMLADLGDNPMVRDTFAEASGVLGYDLWALAQNGPEADLNQTDRTQPAMLAAGVAIWRLWREQGGDEPCVMAGHSLGEYSALVCADSIDFAAAVDLVAERGRLMQAAVPAGEGAMAAILGLEDAQVVAVCAQAAQGDVVSAANFNSPGQVVVAGSAAAVDRAVALATEAGAKKAVKLAVSVPSHCALMRPAADQLAAKLAGIEIRTPRVPVIHNADVAAYSDADRIRDALARQLYQSVRWVEIVQKLAADGIVNAIEAGPGKVLMGLNRRIDRNVKTTPVLDADSLAKALTE